MSLQTIEIGLCGVEAMVMEQRVVEHVTMDLAIMLKGMQSLHQVLLLLEIIATVLMMLIAITIVFLHRRPT